VDLQGKNQDCEDSWRASPRSRKRNRPVDPAKLERGDIGLRRGQFRKISGRNQLIGRVVAIKFSGILAQVTLSIGEQHITSIITADAAKEMRLKPGERAAALIKSTESNDFASVSSRSPG